MTQDTKDVVARLAAWSNDPDDEPPIVLMMAAKSAIQSLSDRIDGLEGALDGLQKAEKHFRVMMFKHGGGSNEADRAWKKMKRSGDIARAALHQEGIAP